jgi:ribosome-associated translation inhibitor RaiA
MTEWVDFALEMDSDLENKETEGTLFDQADTRLRELASGHSDMRGAAVNIREAASGETTPIWEATVVAYVRPEDIAATEKAPNPGIALSNALDALERQIRDKRAKLKRRWEQPGNEPADQEAIEIQAAQESAEEVDPDA